MSAPVRTSEAYAKVTYGSPHWIVRFPHQQRYEFAAAEVRRARPTRLLDYGAGDCHVIQLLDQKGILPTQVIAYEPEENWAEEARHTIATGALSDRVSLATNLDEIDESVDCVLCLGVLEHMPLRQRELFYHTCERLLRPGGVIVVDVPVEHGPAVVVKEAARRTLKRRKPEYSIPDLMRRAVGIRHADPQRVDPSNDATWIQWHANFDYRLVRDELARRFRVTKTYGAPLKWLPAPLGNQEVFIVCERR